MGGAGQLDLVYRPYRARCGLNQLHPHLHVGTKLYMFKFNYQQDSIGVNAGITRCTRKPGSED